MKKSSLKSLYHWFIMSLVMGMPLLITCLSYIPNAFNDNNIVSYIKDEMPTELINGARYHFSNVNGSATFSTENMIYISDVDNIVTSNTPSSVGYGYYLANGLNGNFNLSLGDNLAYWSFVGEFDFTYNSYYLGYSNILPNLTHQVEKDVVNNGAYQVWRFNEWFMNVNINSWYSTLIDSTIGMPIEYSPLNNIIVFPLYGVWVLMFDLVFDCLAVIPNICHSWLEKLKGDHE